MFARKGALGFMVKVALAMLFSIPVVYGAGESEVFYFDSQNRPNAKIEGLGQQNEAVKAILAMYAIQRGGGCEGRDEAGLKCELTKSLGLGVQCSEKHIELVKSWFKKELPLMSVYPAQAIQRALITGDLESICYQQPYTATRQEIWTTIRAKMKDDLVFVDATSFSMSSADGPYWKNRYSTTYRHGESEVIIVKHREVK